MNVSTTEKIKKGKALYRMKGIFIPEITAEMFRNGCLESIEALMAEGEIYDIDYSPWIPVSEYGYPKPEDEYKPFLTVDSKGEITIQEFLLSLDEEPQPYFTGMRNIIAWMLLPEPYKAESVKTE